MEAAEHLTPEFAHEMQKIGKKIILLQGCSSVWVVSQNSLIQRNIMSFPPQESFIKSPIIQEKPCSTAVQEPSKQMFRSNPN